MWAGSGRAAADDAQGLKGPASDPSGDTALQEVQLAEAQGSETPAPIGTREEDVTSTPIDEESTNGAGSTTPLREVGKPGGEPLLSAGDQRVLPADPVREVDRRNGNAARARKQALKEPGVIEAADGSIHRHKATSLVIPEEKRCQAITVRGERCKVGKMRGLNVCVFHAHSALSDDALATIADLEAKPRLSPRKALKAVVGLKAQELAEAAVGGALDSSGIGATRAVLALVDAVDPLVAEEATLTLTSEGVETASLRQLRQMQGP
jgi:hypothetical protein